MQLNGKEYTDEQIIETLKKLRDFYYETHYSKKLYAGGLYPEQVAISDAIIEAFYYGHRRLKPKKDIYIAISRQFGKSFIVFSMIGFLMVFMPKFVGKSVTIGITVNKQDQVEKNYQEVRDILGDVLIAYGMTFMKNNDKTLTISNGSYIKVFSMEANHNQGETLDFSIVDEAQQLSDVKYGKEIVPMLTRTGGISCYAGVGGYIKNDYYYGVLDPERNIVFRYGSDHCIKTVRQRYEETGDERHLLYVDALEEAKTKSNKVTHRTEYEIEWELGVGQIINIEGFEKLKRRKKRNEKDVEGYEMKFNKYTIGIDWGKMGDRSVVSVVGRNLIDGKKVLIEQLCIIEEGVPYTAQVEKIVNWLHNKGYSDKVDYIYCDVTGPGAGPVDILQKAVDGGKIVPISFNETSKHELATTFINLLESDTLVVLVTPENESNIEKLEFELSHIEKGYNKKGQIWYRHPEKGNIHDDFVDSTFLSLLDSKEKEVGSWAYNL